MEKQVLLTLEAYNGTVYVYEDRVVIRRKGVFSLAAGKENSMPFSTITGVKFMEGNAITKGHIKFLIKGIADTKAISFGSVSDSDRYAVLFGKKLNTEALTIKNFVEEKLDKNENSTNIFNPLSSADELKKYKELLDTGVITQEEFDATKKQLLGI
ncbi:MAG: SHOCT domain-containing protein [Clostridia bacterium]|nr:SHOCT domain-containing protein [Clostridia bacterium]